jgi:hypothetical protein
MWLKPDRYENFFCVSCLKTTGIDRLVVQVPCAPGTKRSQKHRAPDLQSAILFYGILKEKALAEVKLKELTGKDLNSPKKQVVGRVVTPPLAGSYPTFLVCRATCGSPTYDSSNLEFNLEKESICYAQVVERIIPMIHRNALTVVISFVLDMRIMIRKE